LEPKVDLTPAQRSFVAAYLSDVSDDRFEVTLAGQAGSQRLFYRIKETRGAARSFILVVWDGHDDDWSRFLAIPKELSSRVSFLPGILSADTRHGLILEEDLGSETLKIFGDRHAADPAALEAMYRKTLDALAGWQLLDTRLSATISSRALDYETFMWETDYFARRFVADFCGAEQLLGKAWEKERIVLAAEAAELRKTFVHRDFQSENIMVMGTDIRFVDFQGARLGPPAYDLASLLFDPYVDQLTSDFVRKLFTYYSAKSLPVRVDEHAFAICAAQRLMQALGAYGNLSLHQGKVRYRAFVPVALERLAGVMDRLPEYEAIRSVVEGCSRVAGAPGVAAQRGAEAGGADGGERDGKLCG
jgi:aminoglycoside/choline kinase family phosphotransferase